METLPTIRQLQYLASLADNNSFSKAAAHCHVTQSTLSAGIRDLETVLRQKLVDRSRKQVALTPFGKTVIEEARLVLAHASEIAAKAKALNKPLSGTLRLGIIPTIAPYLLPKVLPRLRRQFPALSLQLTEDQSARITEQLHIGALDLILLAFPYETPGMTQMPLFEEPFYIASPRGAWHGKNPAAVADLQDQALLLLDEGHCLRDHALAACRFRAHAETGTFNATSLPTLIQFVQHGYGLTMLPEMALGTVGKNVEIIPFANPAPTRKIGMAWRKNHPQEKEFKMLAGAIKASA